MKLNEYLRACRTATGLSRRKLALMHDISQTTLLYIERGRSLPRLETLITLGERLGYEVIVTGQDRNIVLRMSKGNVVLIEQESPAQLQPRFAEILSRLSPEQTDLAYKLLLALAAPNV